MTLTHLGRRKRLDPSGWFGYHAIAYCGAENKHTTWFHRRVQKWLTYKSPASAVPTRVCKLCLDSVKAAGISRAGLDHLSVQDGVFGSIGRIDPPANSIKARSK